MPADQEFQHIKHAVLIVGPTASGKSAMALAKARATGGVIINADAMQVYGVLDVLTARPDAEALAQARHELYGRVQPDQAYSVAAWLDDVRRLAAEGAFDNAPPIFVGGTGLYFTALTLGLSDVPPVPAEIREVWRQRASNEGAEAMHRVLAERDAVMAERLRPTDGQRIVRALEVFDATGRSLAKWQSERSAPLVDMATAQAFVINPDREALRARIDVRFDQMMQLGALDEVRALKALGLDDAMPVMKAIGVRELSAALDGEIAFDEAIAHTKTATHQFAKRQSTWFRNQFDANWKRLTQFG